MKRLIGIILCGLTSLPFSPRLSVLGLLVLVASLPGPASAQSALGNFHVNDTCKIPEKLAIEAARTTVWIPRFVNNHTTFDACMQDAFISADKGLPVERILDIMREPFATSMSCANEAEFCGSCSANAPWGHPGDNALAFAHEYLCGHLNGVPCPATPPAWDVAGVILHEVAHNKNFQHNPWDRDYESALSVNEQLHACIKPQINPNLGPNLVRRSLLPREAELAHIGGHGGGGNNLSESVCSDGFVTGLLIASDTLVRGIQPQCQSVADGAIHTAPAIGRISSSSSGSNICPAGSFVTGLIGNNGDLVDRIGVTCSALNDILSHTSANVPAPPGPLGGLGGLAFQRVCPSGMALAGFQGRSGDALDQLRPVCRQIGVGYQPVQKPKDIFGKREGVDEDLRCSGQGVMIGIFGRAGELLDRVGGICHSIAAGDSGLRDAFMEHATSSGLEASPGGRPFQDRCAPGSALVGFAARSGDSVDQLSGICADLNTWASGSTATDSLAKMTCSTTGPVPCAHGGPGGSTDAPLICASTEFVVGLETWRNEPSFKAGVVVRGLRPVCRHVPFADQFIEFDIEKVGAGDVGWSWDSCGYICLFPVKVGETLSLTATPNPGWVFSHWEGACTTSGTNNVCNAGPLVSNSVAKAVFVSSSPATVALNLTVVSTCPASAAGLVSASPPVVSCQMGTSFHPLTNTCSVSLPKGTSVRFLATPLGYASVSYAGGCTSTTSECPDWNRGPLVINANTNVTAKFCGVIQ